VILSPYTRPDSPWIWVQFAARGDKKQYRKTEIRKDDPHRKRRIEAELRHLRAELLDNHDTADPQDGWAWVHGYLRSRYAAQPKTRQVYRNQWRPLLDYLLSHDIIAPALLERRHAYAYLPWRTRQRKAKSGKNISHNSARGELKLLGLVMDEAVTSHYVHENPVRRLGIGEEDTALKPEITADEERTIRQALAVEPLWMQRAFHIGISTGLRHADCRILATQIRWESDDVLIERPKGGRKREFVIPIYDTIRADLEGLRQRGDRALFEIPSEFARIPALRWRAFFDRACLPHICFHCSRVTFISRGMRAGIPEPVMMRMVNHGSKLISRIYQRWTTDDVRRYATRLAPIPSVSDATFENPPATPAPRATESPLLSPSRAPDRSPAR
jgi:hypothetical protein